MTRLSADALLVQSSLGCGETLTIAYISQEFFGVDDGTGVFSTTKVSHHRAVRAAKQLVALHLCTAHPNLKEPEYITSTAKNGSVQSQHLMNLVCRNAVDRRKEDAVIPDEIDRRAHTDRRSE